LKRVTAAAKLTGNAILAGEFWKNDDTVDVRTAFVRLAAVGNRGL
jgi:hypothetical protein